MIAKKEWFKPRILGWGLRPVTWEGWVYIAIVILLYIGALNLPIEDIARITVSSIVLIVFLIDILVVMFQMYKSLDEREKKHQMIIEASASYAGIIAIIGVAVYQAIMLKAVDTGIWIILGAMLLAKVISSLYLWKNG